MIESEFTNWIFEPKENWIFEPKENWNTPSTKYNQINKNNISNAPIELQHDIYRIHMDNKYYLGTDDI